jgi:hypothetical protein
MYVVTMSGCVRLPHLLLFGLLFATSGLFAMEKPMLMLNKKNRSPERFTFGNNVVDAAAYEYAEVTIHNIFKEPIELRYRVGPQEHFTPVVRNENGEVISTGTNFGITASILREERSLTIPPGGFQTFEIAYPWETVPTEKLKPGVYYLRVQFRRDGGIWESNEIPITNK